ncbi:MAG: tetratricopeptide repeat protein, partial [Candidatus Electrothrix sp. AR1]|nr:tetratricopeptide repeat protein [Candidatus Electrothrix sp. AR1]
KAQGELGTAEKVCRQAIIVFPHNAACRNVLAEVLLQAGEREEAVNLLQETVQKFPANSVARNFLKKIQSNEYISEDLLGDVETAQQAIMQSDEPYFDETSDEKQSDDTEAEIGLISLYRQAGRRAAEEERQQYCEKAASAFERIADKAAYNIPAQLEKGWWLLEQKPEEAEDFFSVQVKKHPNILGFRLGNMRFQCAKGGSTDTKQWNALVGSFSGSSTLVRLEQAMQELTYGNGNRLRVLENLRRRLGKGVEYLPASMRENEKWTRATLAHTLFQTVDTDRPLTENDISTITENYQTYKPLLQGTSEQCLAAA